MLFPMGTLLPLNPKSETLNPKLLNPRLNLILSYPLFCGPWSRQTSLAKGPRDSPVHKTPSGHGFRVSGLGFTFKNFTAAMRTKVLGNAFLNKHERASAQTRGVVETYGWCVLSALTLAGPCGVQWGQRRCGLCSFAG